MYSNYSSGVPVDSPEARENELIAAAVDLAEKQLRDGTASPSVITHYLKLASSRERLQREKLEERMPFSRLKQKHMHQIRKLKSSMQKLLKLCKVTLGLRLIRIKMKRTSCTNEDLYRIDDFAYD